VIPSESLLSEGMEGK